jgi:hypothetical protein
MFLKWFSCGNQYGTFITTKLLDFVHRPDLYKQKTQRFGNWICFRLQAMGGGHLLYRKKKPKACLSTGDARTKVGQPLETRGLYVTSLVLFLPSGFFSPLVSSG